MNYCLRKFLRIHFKYPVRKYGAKSKRKACDLAQEYFDVSYSNIYGLEWPSIRLGLLSEPKHVSIINNQCPKYEETLETFQGLGCYDVGAQYRKTCAEVTSARSRSLVAKARGEGSEELDAKYSSEDHDSAPRRKPIRQFTDDELGELASSPPSPVYPKEFRALSGAAEIVSSNPSSDRFILPQPHVQLEMQIQSLQDFIPSQGLKGLAELSDESQVFHKYRAALDLESNPSFEIQKTNTLLRWPEMLTVLAFPKLNNTRFPKPRPDSSGLFNHYPLDGGSLLPVLLLDVQEGNSVLDMCAAPGGKSLALLQTTLPGHLHCNDKSISRIARLKTIMKQYFAGTNAMKSLHVTQGEGTFVGDDKEGMYDRVLVDAPCLGDRYSLMQTEDNNNIFTIGRRQERLAMPDIQADLLLRALQLVRVGGVVVYSTCTLSPVQNDGVIHLALTRLWDYTTKKCAVVDYSETLQPLESFLNFGKQLGLKYGQVVLPKASNNFGPTYCAKIVRKK